MDHFLYQGNELYAEQLPVGLLAEKWGTPLYIYSRATIERHWRAFDEAFAGHPHRLCYAVKANSNLAVLDIINRLGSDSTSYPAASCSGCSRSGAIPRKSSFPASVKAAMKSVWPSKTVSVASTSNPSWNWERVSKIAAAMKVRAPVALRVNPDVDAGTHPYIATGLHSTKFGIESDRALAVYRRAADDSHLEIRGIACHIGSQITAIAPYLDALDRLLDMVDELRATGITLEHLDLGGGLGIRYRDENPPLPGEFAAPIVSRLGSREPRLCIEIEPGRTIVGNAGILVTTVEYLKETGAKSFAVVDAGMNDLLRPALYQAWQDIVAVRQTGKPETAYDVVGPVCETACRFGSERSLAIEAGDLLAIRSAGAYGAVMANNYNSRPRPAEILVDGDQEYCVRQRESFEHLIAGESMLP